MSLFLLVTTEATPVHTSHNMTAQMCLNPTQKTISHRVKRVEGEVALSKEEHIH